MIRDIGKAKKIKKMLDIIKESGQDGISQEEIVARGFNRATVSVYISFLLQRGAVTWKILEHFNEARKRKYFRKLYLYNNQFNLSLLEVSFEEMNMRRRGIRHDNLIPKDIKSISPKKRNSIAAVLVNKKTGLYLGVRGLWQSAPCWTHGETKTELLIQAERHGCRCVFDPHG